MMMFFWHGLSWAVLDFGNTDKLVRFIGAKNYPIRGHSKISKLDLYHFFNAVTLNKYEYHILSSEKSIGGG